LGRRARPCRAPAAARPAAARHACDPQRAAFDRWHAGKAPAVDAAAIWPELPAADPTIRSSGDVCDALAGPMPELMVLCADLEAPTNHKRGRTAFAAADRSGSYVHCGVREHLMGAMAGGIAAHGGLRPVAVTYLAFADYERPAMRMAALMGLPALFVFSHDSIGVGSNGPTHQPVEILASFRALPNFLVFRPADAVETAEAWQVALEQDATPSLLALSRQPAARVRRDTRDNLVRRGAYVASPAKGERQVTLLATGTEVGIAMEAQVLLALRGIRAAVVSMPCWELFERQDPAYRAEVLGRAPRIAIEAAMDFGWHRWLREGDRFVGMEGFGASARAEVLYEHFGLTPVRIAETAVAMVGEVPA
ncbi:transketolase-like TK C-terminal-containing protein, partial [Mangrovicoccus ximenensis]|uniref:transketolase-like TK C-terminal-containing protein n=1 Tax=Mangrovicoccus ximenensis TaxID=1911570 RepID=UPI002ED252DE